MVYGGYPPLGGVKKVLVVKLRHLGDVLLTSPVFSALKKALPEAQIDAYIYQESVPMLEGHPAIHGFLCYDRGWKKLSFWGRLNKEWALWRQIRKKRYDLVINLTEGDRGIVAALVSAAPIRVGFLPKGWWQKKVLTHVAKDCPTPRHTVERNLDAVRRIGIFPEDRALFLDVPLKAVAAMQQKVGKGPFILIHPTSRWRFKCWPMQQVRQLTEMLLDQGKQVVFTSGPDPVEKEMLEEATKGLAVINLAGQISLKELAALIQMSDRLVCVDSVPLHMASALKKPVVVLFGPSSDVTWGPWQNPKAQVIYQEMSCRPCGQDGCGGSKRSDCLAALPVSRVLRALQPKVLSKVAAASLRVSDEVVDSAR